MKAALLVLVVVEGFEMPVVNIALIVVGCAVLFALGRSSAFAHRAPNAYLERTHRMPVIGALPDNFLLGMVDILFAVFAIAFAVFIIFTLRAV